MAFPRFDRQVSTVAHMTTFLRVRLCASFTSRRVQRGEPLHLRPECLAHADVLLIHVLVQHRDEAVRLPHRLFRLSEDDVGAVDAERQVGPEAHGHVAQRRLQRGLGLGVEGEGGGEVVGAGTRLHELGEARAGLAQLRVHHLKHRVRREVYGAALRLQRQAPAQRLQERALAGAGVAHYDVDALLDLHVNALQGLGAPAPEEAPGVGDVQVAPAQQRRPRSAGAGHSERERERGQLKRPPLPLPPHAWHPSQDTDRRARPHRSSGRRCDATGLTLPSRASPSCCG
mmetsp:Transcript_15136/g.45586  ORF Transcript_15136/g.45586 Transcript_15136/m.45586 type:complete len:286 (-) Transcript_15136:41-898(-)